MRAILQRVLKASVSIEGRIHAQIGMGWLVLLGIKADDSFNDVQYLVDKILNLRGFADAEKGFEKSIFETGGDILVVSQFTLYGDCRKGRRPSFIESAKPDAARELYSSFLDALKRQHNLSVQDGVFQAKMIVALENDGPVTLLLDSRKEF